MYFLYNKIKKTFSLGLPIKNIVLPLMGQYFRLLTDKVLLITTINVTNLALWMTCY